LAPKEVGPKLKPNRRIRGVGPATYTAGRTFTAPSTVHRTTTVKPLQNVLATPYNVPMFGTLLALHPNQEFADYVLDGLTHGFALGIDREEELSQTDPLASALLHPEVVRKYLDAETKAGRMTRTASPPHPFTVTCAAGVVPKKTYDHTPKWRLISHLSKLTEEGNVSINGSINAEEYSCEMIRVTDAIEVMADMGETAVFTLLDLRAGFRQIPVAPEDTHLQVYFFEEHYYCDHQLCFGCRSSPFIFDSCTTAMEWIVQDRLDESFPSIEREAVLLHMVDDFCLVCQDAEIAERASRILFDTLADLGVPLSDEKTEDQVTDAQYLGLRVDAKAQEVYLPDDKRLEMISILEKIVEAQHRTGNHFTSPDRYGLTKKELQSIVGKLTFAHLVICWARPWINEFLCTLMQQPNKHAKVVVSKELRTAAAAFATVLRGNPRRPFSTIPAVLVAQKVQQDGKRTMLEPDATGDSSGEIGFGFFTKEGVYFDWWTEKEKASHKTSDTNYTNGAGKMSSTLQELRCLVAAALCWLDRNKPTAGAVFVYNTDSLNLVHLSYKMRSKTTVVNELWKTLGSHLAPAGVHVYVQWASRETANAKAADALSRCSLKAYRQMRPSARHTKFDILTSIRQAITA